jgi:hypothetical protein
MDEVLGKGSYDDDAAGRLIFAEAATDPEPWAVIARALTQAREQGREDDLTDTSRWLRERNEMLSAEVARLKSERQNIRLQTAEILNRTARQLLRLATEEE